MNDLITSAVRLLDIAGFDFAVCGGFAVDLFCGYETRTHYDIDISVYWEDRNAVVKFMHGLDWTVYEACGGGVVHKIIDTATKKLVKRNLFCEARKYTFSCNRLWR